jgi:hypothetical protein
MLLNRFETEGGAYHFALQDIVDFVEQYGFESVIADIVDEIHSRTYHRSKAENTYTEFGGSYGI